MSLLRSGDTVVVRAGVDRGKTGRILSLDRKHGAAIVEGVNMKWKHVRKSQEQPQGGRTHREYPIALAKLAYFDAEAGKGVRLGLTRTGGKRQRVARPTGKALAN